MISQTQLNSYWHNEYIVLTYITKRDLFSTNCFIYHCFIVTGKVLSYVIFHKNHRKRFIYKQCQLILYVCFHEKTYLKWSLNLACFMDLLLESYKYDKTKVRIIVINYQIVNQIFRIQQHAVGGWHFRPIVGF